MGGLFRLLRSDNFVSILESNHLVTAFALGTVAQRRDGEQFGVSVQILKPPPVGSGRRLSVRIAAG